MTTRDLVMTCVTGTVAESATWYGDLAVAALPSPVPVTVRHGLGSVVPVFLKVRRAGVWRSSCPFLPHAPLEPLSLALWKP
jgi:hypothetical protein